MSYCAQTGTTSGDIMPARINEQQLLQLVTEDDTIGLDEQQHVIDEAIAAADAEIDSYVGVKYAVPVSPVPSRLRNLSADIATYNLYKRRSGSIGMPELVRQTYEDALSFLKDVARGTASLGIDPEPTGSSATGAKVVSNKRVFDKDTLKGF